MIRKRALNDCIADIQEDIMVVIIIITSSYKLSHLTRLLGVQISLLCTFLPAEYTQYKRYAPNYNFSWQVS